MKKIAIIENGWAKFINYAWTLGIKQYMDERGIDADIYIFNSFGDVGMDEKFNHGEYNITKLSDLTMFRTYKHRRREREGRDYQSREGVKSSCYFVS